MAKEITKNPQRITLSGTGELALFFDKTLFPDTNATAYLEWVSGTTIYVCGNDHIDTNDAYQLTSATTKVFFPVSPNKEFYVKGGAGGEVFNISILPVGQ